MLTVGDRLPAFKLTAAVKRTPGEEFADITEGSYPGKWLKATVTRTPGAEFADVSDQSHPGKWLVLFFWPKDFTFVCPTEIAAFGHKNGDFQKRGAQVLGASTDNEYVHLAWREHDKTLAELPFATLLDAVG